MYVDVTLLGLAALSLTCVACTVETERTGVGAQALIGGTASGAEDDDVVAVDNALTTIARTLHCTGTLVAPNLVLTARHCVLQVNNAELPCTADGELVDPSDPRGQLLETQAPERITVNHGSRRTSFTQATAVKIVTPSEVSLCRSDLAFVVLDRAFGAAVRPLRMRPATAGETMRVSGWGYTADGQTTLPVTRSSRDDLRIEEVGPGLIPPGTFAIAGGTLCFGDSGAAAFSGGSVVGVYSRIEGGACSLASGRNVFMMLGPQRALVEEAFHAAGAAPHYEEELAAKTDAGTRTPEDASTTTTPDAAATCTGCTAPAPASGDASCASQPYPGPPPRLGWVSLGALALLYVRERRRRTREAP